MQIYRLVVVQVEAAEAAKKEVEKARSVKKGNASGKARQRSSQNRGREVRRGESLQRSGRVRERQSYRRDYDRDYDRGTIKSTKSGNLVRLVSW